MNANFLVIRNFLTSNGIGEKIFCIKKMRYVNIIRAFVPEIIKKEFNDMNLNLALSRLIIITDWNVRVFGVQQMLWNSLGSNYHKKDINKFCLKLNPLLVLLALSRLIIITDWNKKVINKFCPTLLKILSQVKPNFGTPEATVFYFTIRW